MFETRQRTFADNTGGGSGVNFTVPLIVSSGGTGTTAIGSATTLVGINSSGLIYDYYLLRASDNATVVRSGTGYFISALTGAGSATSTAGLVQSSLTISTIYPLSGGGDLSVSRTHAIDTAFLVNTGRLVSAGAGLSGGGSLAADRTITLVTPVSVTSGGTGVVTFTSGGILFGAGTANIRALTSLGSGALIVGSGNNKDPYLLPVGSHGQILAVNTSVLGLLQWTDSSSGSAPVVYAATGNQYLTLSAAADLTAERSLVVVNPGLFSADSGANNNFYIAISAKTIRIPMSYTTVKISTANAFYTTESGTTIDSSYVRFINGGIGTAYYQCVIPSNVAPSPIWSLETYSHISAGSSGFLVLSIGARVLSNNSTIDAATTQLLSVGSFTVNTINTLTISTMSATNFDATLAVSATQILKVIVNRNGSNASDNIAGNWNLDSLVLRLNVL